MITCLNCGHSFEGNFCPDCGQKATVKPRLTLSVLMEDTLHFFTHLEKGFLYTTWNFLVRPGSNSMNYLEGKRKKHQKPVSYFLIWTGLYILTHNFIVNHYHYRLSEVNYNELNRMEQANVLLRSHFTLFIIPVLLVTSFVIYAVLARPRYNFIEILTLCLYGAGTYFMMLFVSDIVLGTVFQVNIVSTKVFSWQAMLSSLYNLWFSFDLFKRLHTRYLWLRLISVAILISAFGWIMMVYLPLAWIYLVS